MTDVVLVDALDRAIGVREKQQAHVDGALHRAVSVIVFDTAGQRMLLQQRAFDKYHSGGLWANACCSHPAPGESPLDAAHRRLLEELGFDCPLTFAFAFIYRADVGGAGRGPDLVEHELDHVFIARCDPDVRPNAAEVSAVEWVRTSDVVIDVGRRPERYAPWFRVVVVELVERGLIP